MGKAVKAQRPVLLKAWLELEDTPMRWFIPVAGELGLELLAGALRSLPRVLLQRVLTAWQLTSFWTVDPRGCKTEALWPCLRSHTTLFLQHIFLVNLLALFVVEGLEYQEVRIAGNLPGIRLAQLCFARVQQDFFLGEAIALTANTGMSACSLSVWTSRSHRQSLVQCQVLLWNVSPQFAGSG